jgi:hypothetical protein
LGAKREVVGKNIKRLDDGLAAVGAGRTAAGRARRDGDLRQGRACRAKVSLHDVEAQAR